MDCSKFCANFKPKKPPQGLRTADLKIGMVVTPGNNDGPTYTILEIGSEWLKVLRAYVGHTPRETEINLADHGCQLYKHGLWNQTNWLRRVT